LKIEVITSPDSYSFGDALRELDGKKKLTRHDFVLVRGDVVGNIDLLPIMEAHKYVNDVLFCFVSLNSNVLFPIFFRKTAAFDKGALMTVVLSKMLPNHPARKRGLRDEVFVLQKSSNKILLQQNLRTDPKLELPLVTSPHSIQ
jgi:hypothetical protein